MRGLIRPDRYDLGIWTWHAGLPIFSVFNSLESDLIPYSALLCLPAQAVLVLAPHPDDEVFACGGAIARHVAAGTPVSVLVLTDGALYGDSQTRQGECLQAAEVLGYGVPEFWNIPDRRLHYSGALVQGLVEKITSCAIDLVYAPSPWEVHPDHRQAHILAVEAVRRCGATVRVAFYEVGAPLRPNVLLDISSVQGLKQKAMLCFASQLKQQDYAMHMEALNRYRTYTLGREVAAAEAFWVASGQELDRHCWSGLLGMVSPGVGIVDTAREPSSPLVSILVRSGNGAFLSETLDSVALQSYPRIEVLVASFGTQMPDLPQKCGRFPLQKLDNGQTMGGNRASNELMATAAGDFLLFLDEKNILKPDHVARLAYALERQGIALAAYSGQQVMGEYGLLGNQTCELADEDVLFSAKLRDMGCRFDETLLGLANKEFWLKVAELTPFVPAMSD